MISNKIKFGTDGWRAIRDEQFSIQNLSRIAQSTAKWVKEFGDLKLVVLGHDTRSDGELFVKTIAEVLINEGVRVIVDKGISTTPSISLATKKLNADLGIIVTASHNPPEYSGYKLKGNFGGPLQEDDLKWIEECILETYSKGDDFTDWEEGLKHRAIEIYDLEQIYLDQVKSNFDLNLIRESSKNLGYNAMYGSGQLVMSKLLPDINSFHCVLDPTFGGISPEPIPKNLVDFEAFIKGKDFSSSLVNDGDADRLAMYDENGNYVDSHHLMLIILLYLAKYKGEKGKVVTGVSTTPRLEKMARQFGLDFEYVKIGFKHACGVMLKDDVLLAGEESGGMAVKGHIPERDGIWNGMIIWEFMSKTNKTLGQIIQEVYDIVGPFHYLREDLKVSEENKQSVVEYCQKGNFNSLAGKSIKEVITIDGFKYIFNDDEWLMIRPSGTEPVLRLYAESKDKESAQKILSTVKEELKIS